MKVLSSIESLKKLYYKLLTDVAKESNLTLMELKILLFLDKNESNVAKDIVEGIKATKSHVSIAVCSLEQKKFIEKIQDENDKKKSHLQLTKKSNSVITKSKEVQGDVKNIMFQGLKKEEIKLLTSVANKIKSNLENYNLKGGK